MIHRYQYPSEVGRRLNLSKETYLEDLEDYRCPSCGYDESFVFDTRGSVEVFKDGRHEYKFIGMDFVGLNVYAKCPKCKHRDIWNNFNKDIQNTKEAPVLKFLLSWWSQYKDTPVNIGRLRYLAYQFRIFWRDHEEGKRDELPANIMDSRLALSGNILLKPVLVDEGDVENHYRLVGKTGVD